MEEIHKVEEKEEKYCRDLFISMICMWYFKDTVNSIKIVFKIGYSKRRGRRILKEFAMNHAKPYQAD